MLFRYKIALLNVLRNRRRSVLTLLAIQVGVISLVLFGGFVASMSDGMRENMIRSELGHLQIYKKGFNQYGHIEPEKYLLSQSDLTQITHIVEAITGVELITPRLDFSGLLTNGNQSIAIVGNGINPDKEALLSSAITITQGEDLFPQDSDGALLGQGLFNALNTKVGDYLTLLSSTTDGAVNAVDIKVVGAINTGVRDVDNRLIRINLPHAQDLQFTDGISRLVVLLSETDNTQVVIKQLNEIFEKEKLPLEIKSWSQLADYYHEVVKLFEGVFGFIKVIVLFIAALSIANTMMMAVMERTPEIGSIRALGATRYEIMMLFLTEAFYLGIFGSVLGVLFGILLANGITLAEFIMPTPPGSSQSYPIRIFIEWPVLWQTAITGIFVAVIASIYPAFKASRLLINQAMRSA
ncbi:ABC transporter permease [Pseudoalteromonas denitrificans]|uniref:Putative ABC transport system permease protein n=1 Tax=Pseudoalteromonas denitrificans DSM 6059 TaxID=1123010 RepID=A0A1I1I7N9_9GAMM|nr:FtsX-like permease family protein [Pseudoalteromonas denitrificans]SFC32287.1 putative ABC transport system permease protein [Pseudoalteromonas denitrificans DSM 6059]